MAVKLKKEKNLLNPVSIFSLSFCVFGMILSLALWRYKVINVVPPCTVSGCSHVLTGKYSEIFDAPVSLYGFFFYAFLSMLFFQRLFFKSSLIQFMIILFLIWGWIFTIYLRYLEIFKLGNWCEWCWMSVLFMVTITVSFSFEARINSFIQRNG